MPYGKIILLLLLCAGAIVSWIYGKSVDGFRWRELLAFAFAPLVGILWYALFVDNKILIFFFFAAVTGFTAEFILGIFLEQAFGRKWWYYPRLSIMGHTSFFSLPIWGYAGTIFWIISGFVGLH